MQLIKEGIVRRFVLYELSDEAIRIGKENATNMGIGDRCEFIKGDCFRDNVAPESFDFVYWNDSLHHMTDVDLALRWSHEVLKKDGVFFMDDFVGPSRFQWTTANLKCATLVRSMLAPRYLRDPLNPQRTLPTRVRRRSVRSVIDSDPSEAAQSDMILGCLRRYFQDADICLTGGALYHAALGDGIINNFQTSDPTDRNILNLILALDELCIHNPRIGTHYATALAFKGENRRVL
jgi:SAM-dependent methyltransferase